MKSERFLKTLKRVVKGYNEVVVVFTFKLLIHLHFFEENERALYRINVAFDHTQVNKFESKRS